MELEPSAAQEIVARIDERNQVRRITRLHGASADIFELGLARGRSLIVKIYPDQPAWKLQKEAYVARLIGDRLDVPAPTWLAADETRELLPRRFAVMTRLPGAPLREMRAEPQAPDLYRRMGKLLRQLHTNPMEAFGYIMRGGLDSPCATNAQYMDRCFAAKFRDFRKFGGDGQLVRRIEILLSAGRAALAACGAPVLCHNDFHLGNVLAAKGEDGAWALSGLIDFENALAGDPLFDLAKAMDYSAHEEPLARTPLLEGYGALRAGAAEALRIYRLYHNLELWTWFARIGMDEAAPARRNLLRDLNALA